jgi:autotransporter-associated beta strand protein
VTLQKSVTLTANPATFTGTVIGGNNSLTVTGGAVFDGVVSGLSALTVSGLTTINTATISATGNQTYGGPVTLGTAVTLTAGTVTFNAVVTGDTGTALTIAGAAVLNGGEVTTGGDQLYKGAVTLGHDTTLNAVNVTFAGALDSDTTPRTLTVNSNTAGVTTFAQAVGGAHPLASLTINPVGAPAGTTLIEGGAVTTTGGQSYGDAVTLMANTALTSKAGGAIAFAAPVDGTSVGGQSLTLQTAGDVFFNAAVGAAGRLNALTLTGVRNVTAAATIAAVGVRETSGTGTTTLDGAVDVSGPAGLVLNTLAVLLADAIGTAGGPATFNTAVALIGNVAVHTNGGAIAFSGSVDADAAGNQRMLTLTGGGGNITLAGAVGAGQRLGALTVVSANNVTTAAVFAGAITQLAGSGTTTTSGVLDASGTGGVSLTGTSFSLGGGANLSAGPLTVNAATLMASGPALNLGGNTFLVTLSGTGTVNAVIAGFGAGLTKEGPGVLTLGGVNTYTGLAAVHAGRLTMAATSKLDPHSSLNVNGDGTNVFDLGGTSQTLSAVTLTAGQIIGPGTLASAADFDLRSGTVSAVLGGSSNLVKSTAATVLLIATNTYTGNTVVNAGLLATAVVNNALPVTTTVNVLAGATLQLGFVSQTVAALIGRGNVAVVGSSAVILTVGPVSSEFDGVLSGPGGLTKIGGGSFILTGTETYTGPTTVNSGFLVVNGSAASSTVTVNGGGSLNGSGVVGSIVVNGGIVAPGTTGSAVLTDLNGLSLVNGGAFWPKLGGPVPGSNYDQLVVGHGPISLGQGMSIADASVFNLKITGGFVPYRYTSFTVLVNKTGQPINGTFRAMLWNGDKAVAPVPGQLTDGAIFQGSDGNAYLINYHGNGGNDVVVTRLTPNYGYVRQIYADILGRTNESFTDVTFWSGFLDTGTSTPLDVVRGILDSREYRNDVVANDFVKLLGREPRPDEFDLFATRTATNAYAFSDADVAFAILTSPEYNALHADSTDFVRSLYTNLLNVPAGATPAGLGLWVSSLATASLTRAQVVTGFLGSQAVFDQAINSYYTVLLHARHGAAPSAAEKQFWDGFRDPNTTTPGEIIPTFLTSAEYLAGVSAQVPKAG